MSDPQILFYDLAPGVTACSVERGDITPDDPYSGFNACHYVGDSTAHVDRCRRQLSSRLGVNCLIMPRQTHGTDVAIVSSASDSFDDTDALVSDKPHVALCINTADCVPLLMADPVARVIAAVHSGWRGTVNQIAARAVETMISLGAKPSRIKAVAGPSICPDCFEVGHEVAGRFAPAHVITGHAKPHIDLRQAIADTLIAAGIPATSIDITTAPCSRCNPDHWCSARAQGTNSSRTLSAIWIH